jgi:radical SAM protein with 4Fe4S-binding SPASM domain
MELTERCNNNCQHCFINLPEGDKSARSRELTTDEIKKILNEAVSLGCMSVRFTGGEPLLREDFEELYLFARRIGLKVMLFTNATLINEHLVGLFLRVPPLEKIEITVYGMHKESYDLATRTKGSFEKAWRGINLLLTHGIPFVVKGAILPSNKDELDEFESWYKTIPWMDKPAGYSMFFDLRCHKEEDRNELIRKVRLTPEEGLKILSRDRRVYLEEMKRFCSKFMHPSGEKLISCGSGVGSGSVNAYGFFQPCLMLRHPDTLYDLKKGTLEDALKNFFPKLRELKAKDPAYLSRCARCFLKGLCEQCPAKSWSEYGTMDKPVDYCCEVAHVQARYMGLLKEGEKAWEVKDWKNRVDDFCGNGHNNQTEERNGSKH